MKKLFFLATLLISNLLIANELPNLAGLDVSCNAGHDRAFLNEEETVYIENNKVTFFDNDSLEKLAPLGNNVYATSYSNGKVLSFQIVKSNRNGKIYAVARKTGAWRKLWLECL